MEEPRELAELTLNQDAIQAPMRVILVAPTLRGGDPISELQALRECSARLKPGLRAAHAALLSGQGVLRVFR
jgi:hypothetical protein